MDRQFKIAKKTQKPKGRKSKRTRAVSLKTTTESPISTSLTSQSVGASSQGVARLEHVMGIREIQGVILGFLTARDISQLRQACRKMFFAIPPIVCDNTPHPLVLNSAMPSIRAVGLINPNPWYQQAPVTERRCCGRKPRVDEQMDYRACDGRRMFDSPEVRAHYDAIGRPHFKVPHAEGYWVCEACAEEAFDRFDFTMFPPRSQVLCYDCSVAEAARNFSPDDGDDEEEEAEDDDNGGGNGGNGGNSSQKSAPRFCTCEVLHRHDQDGPFWLCAPCREELAALTWGRILAGADQMMDVRDARLDRGDIRRWIWLHAPMNEGPGPHRCAKACGRSFAEILASYPLSPVSFTVDRSAMVARCLACRLPCI